MSKSAQREWIAQLRDESILTADDPSPIGIVPSWRPEYGPDARTFYKNKFARGEPSRFWFHQTQRLEGRK